MQPAVSRRVVSIVALLRLLEGFDRGGWLYRARGVRTSEPRFRPPRPATGADLELCRRLIDAYRLARSQAPPPAGMWSHQVFHQRQRSLTDALDRGAPAPLADVLGSMFRSDVVLGMAPGSLAREPRRGPLARLSWLLGMSKLVRLAEAAGTVRAENPEQGPAAPALKAGVERLVDGLEGELGLSLDFPDVGAAYGLVAGGRLITPESPDNIYGALRLRELVASQLSELGRAPRIVEIGGGYGGMAYWLLKMIDDAEYTIIDLPVVGVLQGYFLAQALGHDVVALHGEPRARVNLVPDHALDSVQAPFDVLANKDSLPEIPVDAATGYVRWASSACTGFFYSNNHECAVDFVGTAQNVVCELVDRLGGFERVRREASWLRPGYVEEVFLPTAGR